MIRKIESGEAIVLHSREGREGGKTLSLFTMQKGRMAMSLPRTVMARCGSGLTAPFSLIRYTASVEGEYALLSQYEGHLLFDMMKLPYEDMAYWFYVIELSEKLFPQGEKDDGAYDTLLKAGSMGGKRNSLPLCFMTGVKLLAQSGFDAASPEEAEETTSPPRPSPSLLPSGTTAGRALSPVPSPGKPSMKQQPTWKTSWKGCAISGCIRKGRL